MSIMSAMLIIGIIAVVVILRVVGVYNRLVTFKNNIENAYADIDVQMKARFDLVENLVSTVKGYAAHEKQTLTDLTEARTSFMKAHSGADKAQADNMLSGALKSLFAVAENYPDLKANQNFLQLQNELSDLENKIAASRRFYNSSIKEYNVGIQSFPGNIIAGMFGFHQTSSYFEVTNAAERTAPKVQF